MEILLIPLLVVYFIPSIVAVNRSRSAAAIFAFNLLLGCQTNRPEPTAVHTVAYDVDGDCSWADLTYRNKYGDTEQRSDEPIPNRVNLGEVPRGFTAYMSAQCQDDASKRIAVSLVVDGKIVKFSESSGRFVIATASGQPQ